MSLEVLDKEAFNPECQLISPHRVKSAAHGLRVANQAKLPVKREYFDCKERRNRGRLPTAELSHFGL